MGDITGAGRLSRHSTFLFKVPGYIDGAGPVMDASGQGFYRYATRRTGAQADRRALHHDAQAVAADLAGALLGTAGGR